ncbi:MAG: TIGR01777 family protein [Candidatus Omnitrophica bacterium]|nr:TIGR01777 family protein [Candidatus Omnitrophota bacterium]
MGAGRIAFAGSGGLIGGAVLPGLESKYEVVRLKHRRIGEWPSLVDGAHAVINLAGAPIAEKRWTPRRKKELIQSRLGATRALVDAMAQAKDRPKVFLSASAVGYYGAHGDETLDEASPAGSGFLADLCREWERQALKARAHGVRVVLLRTGIVLSPRGGALAKMLPLFRLGLGGPMGSGRQWMSWIHIDDEVGGIHKALEDGSIQGPVNLTAPDPVSMGGFARTLGKTLHRPALFPVPGFALKLLLGEMSGMLLTGQRVRPGKLLAGGFSFRYPTLESSLVDLLGAIRSA